MHPFTSVLFRLIASTCFEHFFAHRQEVLYVHTCRVLIEIKGKGKGHPIPGHEGPTGVVEL
jgi:hypothetical protein